MLLKDDGTPGRLQGLPGGLYRAAGAIESLVHDIHGEVNCLAAVPLNAGEKVVQNVRDTASYVALRAVSWAVMLKQSHDHSRVVRESIKKGQLPDYHDE